MERGHPVRQRAQHAQLSLEDHFQKIVRAGALRRTGCPRSVGLDPTTQSADLLRGA